MIKRGTADEELVNLAVQELEDKGEKVTVAKVANITGFSLNDIYSSKLLVSYVNRYNKITPKHISSDIQHAPQEKLAHTLESYTLYIKDNYFSRVSTVTDVMNNMWLNVEGFSKDLFNMAINKMQVEGLLRPSSLLPGSLSGHFDDPATDMPKFIIFNQTTLQYEKVVGESELGVRIETLLGNDDSTLMVYKLVEIAKPVRKIDRTKIA